MARFRTSSVAAVLLVIALLVPVVRSPVFAEETARIAHLAGLGQLPLMVMRDQKLIEKHAPGTKVEWLHLKAGTALRDGMLAGQLDIGGGGVAPFIHGWGKGILWKMLSPEHESPYLLVTNQTRIQSLKDFTPRDKIALPSPKSHQHIFLMMAAEKETGNAKALDNLLVSMGHADGLQAFLAKQVVAHFSTIPFQYQEADAPGSRVLLSSYEVLGGSHSTAIVWAMEEWVRSNPRAYEGFVKAMEDAIQLINKNPLKAAEIYRVSTRSGLAAKELVRLMALPGMSFNTTPKGLMKTADFMFRAGLIETKPDSWKDLVFDHLKTKNGS